MTNEFETLIRQLGEAVYNQVSSAMEGKIWESCFLDVRYDNKGSSWLSRIRVLISDGRILSVKMSNEIDIILISLNSQRRIFTEEWFGIILNILPDKRCEIELNYNS